MRASDRATVAGGLHLAELERVGVEAGVRTGLDGYLQLLARWNRRVDLTAARDARSRVEVLVREPAAAAGWIEGPRLLDVGSGNGSPGLVLALLRADLRVTLLEPRLKRWAFLREACRRLGREDVEVVRVRHDAYRGAACETLTLRAVRVELAELERLIQPGGRLVVFGRGRRETAELREEPVPGFAGQVFRRCST